MNQKIWEIKEYGNDVGIDLGIRPQNGIFSVTLKYGKIMTAAVR